MCIRDSILVFARALLTAPGMVRGNNFGQVGFIQFAMNAVDEGAHLAGINEKGFLPAVAPLAVMLILGEEPETDRNLRGVE